MKRFIVLAGFALCVVTASAQNNLASKNKKSALATSNEKGYGESKPNKDVNPSTDRVERKALKKAGKEERKMAKKAEKQYRKNDKIDDGIINGSAPANPGAILSKTDRETTLEGRAKGKAISESARSNGMDRAKADQNRPDKSTKKPAAAKQNGNRPAPRGK